MDSVDMASLRKSWDTSLLIAEIRQLAREVGDCILPRLQNHRIVQDIQCVRKKQVYDGFQNISDTGVTSESDDTFINPLPVSRCFQEIHGWQQQALRLADKETNPSSDSYDNRRLKNRTKKHKHKWTGICSTDDVEEEIRRQREKFYEDKGWVVRERQSQKKVRKVWRMMIKKELGKAARQRITVRKEKISILRKAARECSRFCRQRAVASQKCGRDALNRGRRLAREISFCWRQIEKEEKTSRKKADKILTEQKRKSLEMLEAKRQQRKLNYLITQTELYAHFMSKKMGKETVSEPDENAWSILDKIDEKDPDDKGELVFDKNKTMACVKEAVDRQTQQIEHFSPLKESISDIQPSYNQTLFRGELKSYQVKGRDWLLYLFEQGINGILADEMGLGKTIQTIAFLASLAEKYDLWGPFLIVAPASTVHNWTQEFNRFLPAFRVVPYWGNVSERKILRRFWNTGVRPQGNDNVGNNAPGILQSDSSFHVVVSSYQVVLQDAKMVSKVRWQYLVLDEAHAIKNTSSQRWNTLLSFECRNRLLLTGTPIQNTMQELWALLHFIMPTLFDSHEEFNDWFSRDIESQATAAVQNNASKQQSGASSLTTTRLNSTQLSRLHLILQPFMLRRVKTEVEHELPEKIEKLLQCHLSSRQQALYTRLKKRIRIDDLNIDSRQQKSLLNLVMQLRKVCNHPDLLEPRMERFSVHTSFLSPYLPWPRLAVNLINDLNEVVRRLFFVHQPQHAYHAALYDPLSVMAFCQPFRICPMDLVDVFVGYNGDGWCSLEKCWERVNDNTNNDTLYALRKDRMIPNDLLIPEGSIGIADWSIVATNGTIIRLLQAMPIIDSCLLQSPCVIANAIAVPIRLAVSTATRSSYQLISISAFIPLPASVHLITNETRIADSTKLAVLDKLLAELKRNGHRVLIYSQMTRMIDIIEDLMRLRAFSFIRLDGSSRLSDRRDMVAEFQSSDSDIFAFLLSTRAGGLGINLTAADTVIFYDSDWNPTVDQQAMDRAHRLGQDRQVTVYRLVCRDTVEEKILFRAEEKRQMHRMVIAGADLCLDQMRPRDVASLLLEDDEVHIRLEQRRRQSINSRMVATTSITAAVVDNLDDVPLPLVQHDQQQQPVTPMINNFTDDRLTSSVPITFSESSLNKKRRAAWAGMTKTGGRPKKLKLLEPTINNGSQIKKTPSTSSIPSTFSSATPDGSDKRNK